MMFTSSTHRRGRAGAAGGRTATATVEFALLAPIFVTFFWGICEIGRALTVKQILSDAARYGCRQGIQPGNGNSAITTAVSNVLNDYKSQFDPTQATVTITVNGTTVSNGTPDALTATTNTPIGVKVSISADKVSWITPRWFSTTAVESENIVMMKQ